jgi:hypothetical protein
MAKLKLGVIVDDRPVKLTVELIGRPHHVICSLSAEDFVPATLFRSVSDLLQHFVRIAATLISASSLHRQRHPSYSKSRCGVGSAEVRQELFHF